MKKNKMMYENIVKELRKDSNLHVCESLYCGTYYHYIKVFHKTSDDITDKWPLLYSGVHYPTEECKKLYIDMQNNFKIKQSKICKISFLSKLGSINQNNYYIDDIGCNKFDIVLATTKNGFSVAVVLESDIDINDLDNTVKINDKRILEIINIKSKTIDEAIDKYKKKEKHNNLDDKIIYMKNKLDELQSKIDELIKESDGDRE